MPYNFAAGSFHTKKLCKQTFFNRSAIIEGKRIELFSLGVTVEALRAIIGSKSAISLQWGPVDSTFQVEGVAPTNYSFSPKTRLNDLSYGIKKSSLIFLPFCHNLRV